MSGFGKVAVLFGGTSAEHARATNGTKTMTARGRVMRMTPP